jgi:putative transposase
VIAELSARWPVLSLCREMGVNRSGFYKYLSRLRRPSERARQRAGAIKPVLETHAAYPSHGYRWINAKIRLDDPEKEAIGHPAEAISAT